MVESCALPGASNHGRARKVPPGKLRPTPAAAKGSLNRLCRLRQRVFGRPHDWRKLAMCHHPPKIPAFAWNVLKGVQWEFKITCWQVPGSGFSLPVLIWWPSCSLLCVILVNLLWGGRKGQAEVFWVSFSWGDRCIWQRSLCEMYPVNQITLQAIALQTWWFS